jgi:hypothetical protein
MTCLARGTEIKHICVLIALATPTRRSRAGKIFLFDDNKLFICVVSRCNNILHSYFIYVMR